MHDTGACAEIVSAARISIDPAKRKELFLSISTLLNRIRTEHGCRAYRFYRDATQEDAYLLIGEWRTLNDWVSHLQSDEFTVLLGCLEILGKNDLELKVLSQVDEVEQMIGYETNSIGERSATYDSSNRATFYPA